MNTKYCDDYARDQWTHRMTGSTCCAIGGGALSDTAIRPSVCLSHGAAAVAISTLAACSLATAGCTRDVRTADPSADGRRSAASWTAIGDGTYRLAAPRGDNLFRSVQFSWCAVNEPYQFSLAVDCGWQLIAVVCCRVIQVRRVKLVMKVHQVKMGWLVHLAFPDLQ